MSMVGFDPDGTPQAGVADFVKGFKIGEPQLTEEQDRELDDIIGDGPSEEESRARTAAQMPSASEIFADNGVKLSTLADVPDFTPEDEDDRVLIKGRWLERGGSAFIVSTSGSGKSIHSMQLSMSFSMGIPFGGLTPSRPLRIVIAQTEDLPTRLAIDREDITAELCEQHPEIDWRVTWENVHFVNFSGLVGSDFLNALDSFLTAHEGCFDVLIINPFLAFIGGPIMDGQYVTPFLRGGEINRKKTKGLQFILETHRIATIIYHHTPKPPPNSEEAKAWMKSAFPEYLGAGSADITNWGRSFLTMMRLPDQDGVVCFTAGKNGGDLGWPRIDGAFRHYLAYSDAQGCGGKARHGWRELSEDEFAKVTKNASYVAQENAQIIADWFRAVGAETTTTARQELTKGGSPIKVREWREAFAAFANNLASYGLIMRRAKGEHERKWSYVYGTEEGVNDFISANFD